MAIEAEGLRAAFGSAADAIILTDARGVVLECNPAAERLFGWSESELSGRSLSVLMPERFRERHERALGESALEERPTAIRSDVLGLRRDGSEFPIELSLSIWKADGASFFMGTARDITERKRMEAQVRHGERLESIGRIAGGIAHDFNNLLTTILGYTELVAQHTALEEPAHSWLIEVQQAGQNAATLTRRLFAEVCDSQPQETRQGVW